MTISMKRLGEVSKIIAGQSPPSSTYNQDGDGLPFYQGKIDFSEWFPKTRMWCSKPVKISEPGDVLISVRAPVGPTNLCQEISCIGRGLGAIRPNPGTLDSHYLIHFVRSSEKEIASMGRGSTFSAITRGDLEDIQIPIPHKNGKPDLDEQKRIAAILDKADAIRRKRQQALRLTDDFLRSVFLDMFGDPVTNPMGWKKRPLSDALENIDSGWSPVCHSNPAAPNEWGVLKLGAVTWCSYNESENKALPAHEVPREQHEVQVGDLLFCRKNTHELVAAAAYVFETRPKLMIPDLIFRLRLHSKSDLHPIFLWHLLNEPRQKKLIQSLAGGAAGSMPNISKAKLNLVSLIRPPLNIQEKFAALVEQCRNKQTRDSQQADESSALFSSLQQRAFRGEL